MLPIGSELPTNTDTFRAAIEQGLAPLGLNADAIAIEGEFPQFAAFKLSLSGARYHRDLAVSRPAGCGQPLCFARSAHITGSPFYALNIPLELDIQAEDVVLARADASVGSGKVLAFGRVGSGTLDLSAQKSDLEAALFALGQTAAKSKGAELQSVALTIASESARTLAIRAVITAKAMFFTTTVTVSGKLTVDDHLDARLTALDCEGDGMIGKMAAGALRDQFQKLESKVIPLGRALSGVALRDLTLSGGDSLRIHGIFGATA